MVTVPPSIIAEIMPSKGKECAFFATAGERGIVKIWRSDTGKAVCEEKLLAGTHQGGELMDLMLWGEDKGLVTASADCCLKFLNISVSRILASKQCCNQQLASHTIRQPQILLSILSIL